MSDDDQNRTAHPRRIRIRHHHRKGRQVNGIPWKPEPSRGCDARTRLTRAGAALTGVNAVLALLAWNLPKDAPSTLMLTALVLGFACLSLGAMTAMFMMYLDYGSPAGRTVPEGRTAHRRGPRRRTGGRRRHGRTRHHPRPGMTASLHDGLEGHREGDRR